MLPRRGCPADARDDGGGAERSTTGDPAFNSPWSYTGLPTVSVPGARNLDDLPLAIQLVGAPWTEAALFAAAAWCEEVLGFEDREPALAPK